MFDNMADDSIASHIVFSNVGNAFSGYNNLIVKNMSRSECDAFAALLVGCYGRQNNFFFSSDGYYIATTGSGNQVPMYFGQLTTDPIIIKHSKDCFDMTLNLYSYTDFNQDWTLA